VYLSRFVSTCDLRAHTDYEFINYTINSIHIIYYIIIYDIHITCYVIFLPGEDQSEVLGIVPVHGLVQVRQHVQPAAATQRGYFLQIFKSFDFFLYKHVFSFLRNTLSLKNVNNFR